MCQRIVDSRRCVCRTKSDKSVEAIYTQVRGLFQEHLFCCFLTPPLSSSSLYAREVANALMRIRLMTKHAKTRVNITCKQTDYIKEIPRAVFMCTQRHIDGIV